MQYKYGVKATIGDQESEFIEMDRSIMIESPLPEDFAVSNLSIKETSGGAELSWDHDICITSYRIRSCTYEGVDKVCYEQQVVTEGIVLEKMKYTLTNMKSCSRYLLQIYPSLEDEELAIDEEPAIFRTKSLFTNWTDIFTVTLNNSTDQIDLSWSKVECAAGYELGQRIGVSEIALNATYYGEHEVGALLERPEPCMNIRYVSLGI